MNSVSSQYQQQKLINQNKIKKWKSENGNNQENIWT